MNVTIDREKFKQLLLQFKGDIPYQTELINQLLSQLPDNYLQSLVRTLYYEYSFIGTYYIVEHATYTYDKHIFLNYAEVLEFLNSVKLEDKLITKFTLTNAIKRGTTINGYFVKKIIKDIAYIEEVDNA